MKYKHCLSLIFLICVLLFGCEEQNCARNAAYTMILENPAQYAEYEGLQASSFGFSVHLDKTTYAYTDLIYVTAIFVNQSDKPMTLWTPSESRFFHQELPTVITNGTDELVDVDTLVLERLDMGPSSTTGTLVLEPMERYVQTMRFSPNIFSNFDGNKVQLDSGEAAAGDYHGTITAYVMECGTPVAYTVEFNLTITPDPGLCYPHW